MCKCESSSSCAQSVECLLFVFIQETVELDVIRVIGKISVGWIQECWNSSLKSSSSFYSISPFVCVFG